MKVAVVTPYHRTPISQLRRCLTSVADQAVSCRHFLVCDGDDPPFSLPEVDVIRLPAPHCDSGNAARAIGAVSAACRGYDAVAFLDADNWYDRSHIQRLVEAAEANGAVVASSHRRLFDENGVLLGPCPEVDGERFVDTNCLLLLRPAFPLIASWFCMPDRWTAIGDRVVWKAIKDSGLKRVHVPDATVNYTTRYRNHYLHFNKLPPENAKSLVVPLTRRQARDFGLERDSRSPLRAASGSPRIEVAEAASVSLCMIVRNEEKVLRKCLSSIHGLVREMLVIDTGSTDRTVEVAESLGAKVEHFEWCDDFSAARNASIARASGDWILWLDADESFDGVNRRKLAKLFASLKDEPRAYMMKQWSPPNAAGNALIVDQARLFRKHPQAKWKYRLHEQVLPCLQELGYSITVTDIQLRHTGYLDAKVRSDKFARNLRILKKDFEERPDDGFVHFNLGALHAEGGDLPTAIGHLRRCIELTPQRASFLPKALGLLARLYRATECEGEALRICSEGKVRFPDHLDFWYEEGLIRQASRDLDGARAAFEHVLSHKPKTIWVGADPATYGPRTRHQLAFVYRDLGCYDLARNAWRTTIEESPRFAAAWLGLLELHLRTKDVRAAESLLKDSRKDVRLDAISAGLFARLELARKNPDEAAARLENALTKHPADRWLRHLLADIYMRNAKGDTARRHLQILLDDDPKDLPARTKLQTLETGATAEPATGTS